MVKNEANNYRSNFSLKEPIPLPLENILPLNYWIDLTEDYRDVSLFFIIPPPRGKGEMILDVLGENKK